MVLECCVFVCQCVCVYRLPCAAVKEDEPQLTDRGVEKVEHPFPTLLQSLAFSSSAPSRLRRMPVQHHLGIVLASLSTQAIRMNEAEMRYNKADTQKKQETEIVSVPAYRLGVFQGGNSGPALSAGKRKKRKDGGNKTKQNKKGKKSRARNNTPLSQGAETVGFPKRTASVCLNHKLTLSVCVSLSLPRSLAHIQAPNGLSHCLSAFKTVLPSSCSSMRNRTLCSSLSFSLSQRPPLASPLHTPSP